MNAYINRDDPDCCQLCGQWLALEKCSEIDKRVHESCLSQMLYDEWMADKTMEEMRLGYGDEETA